MSIKAEHALLGVRQLDLNWQSIPSSVIVESEELSPLQMREELVGQPVGRGEPPATWTNRDQSQGVRKGKQHPTLTHLISGCVVNRAIKVQRDPRRAYPTRTCSLLSTPCPDQAGSVASVSVQRFLPTKGSRWCFGTLSRCLSDALSSMAWFLWGQLHSGPTFQIGFQVLG